LWALCEIFSINSKGQVRDIGTGFQKSPNKFNLTKKYKKMYNYAVPDRGL